MGVHATYITPLSTAKDGKCDGVSRSLDIDTHSLMNVVMEDVDGTLANPRQLLRYFCLDGEVAPLTARMLQKLRVGCGACMLLLVPVVVVFAMERRKMTRRHRQDSGRVT